MKWFFALNESSLRANRPFWESMVLAAVDSARRHTSLSPHLIFDGDDDAFTRRLEGEGVRVIRRRVSFYDALERRAEGRPGYLPIASGAFLRVEIPQIEQQSDFILYTDCDVLFFGDVKFWRKPKYFACAPEHNRNDHVRFNTGAMLMNLASLRRSYDGFVRFITGNLDKLITYDQDAYRIYYGRRCSRLPLHYNWKPYWGVSSRARIVHFHGPKPVMARDLLAGRGEYLPAELKTIFGWNVEGYRYYTEEWLETVQRIGYSI